ncbi:MAG TPA: rhodanese-like domain-containing protein [Paludibacteraceae bacterium]|nr:rhodanese-like domain-containing protein [Paludibacteraceae bacterium]
MDKHIPVAIYCRAGRRSKIAAEKMSAIGLQGYELDNGIVSWENELTR